MQVKLISYSQTDGNELISSTSPTELVAFCARVSNPDNQNNQETSEKLIKYLMKHKHWSPLEMVSVCLEIETTRDIARQILRHRSFSFQEYSQRYADPTKDLQFEVREARLQDPKNRQNSIDDLDPFTKQELQLKAKYVFEQAQMLYDEMLGAGVAKECARNVLPLSSPTKMYMNGTLRSWVHYCDLRCSNGTQLEHKIIADQCKKLIIQQFPMVAEACAYV